MPPRTKQVEQRNCKSKQMNHLHLKMRRIMLSKWPSARINQLWMLKIKKISSQFHNKWQVTQIRQPVKTTEKRNKTLNSWKRVIQSNKSCFWLLQITTPTKSTNPKKWRKMATISYDSKTVIQILNRAVQISNKLIQFKMEANSFHLSS